MDDNSLFGGCFPAGDFWKQIDLSPSRSSAQPCCDSCCESGRQGRSCSAPTPTFSPSTLGLKWFNSILPNLPLGFTSEAPGPCGPEAHCALDLVNLPKPKQAQHLGGSWGSQGRNSAMQCLCDARPADKAQQRLHPAAAPAAICIKLYD